MREMLVHHDGDLTAVALTCDRQLEEIVLPCTDKERLFGNIYLGKVENVLPGMQAAFVDIGQEKNSFLYVEDALPAHTLAPLLEGETRRINELVKTGQQVVVQIFKEPSGTKGARVTMRPSLPGRYLVLLPMGNYIAVSRRIEDEAERARLRELVRAELPENMGAIVRTVAENTDGTEIAADLQQLLKEWSRIQSKALKSKAPALLVSDTDVLKRVIRDTNPADIDRIVVASNEDYEQLFDLIAVTAPILASKLVLQESRDLFLDYDIYSALSRALSRKTWLNSGGYIIIDQMEALTAIDVNTGKYVGERNLNDTVFKTNMEAVTEIARQLRLRNIGGIIIIDFIDMDNEEDKEKLLAALKEAVKTDRVRVIVMDMTQLGLVEMTRKKAGHDLSSVLEAKCEHCDGKGKIVQLWKKHILPANDLHN